MSGPKAVALTRERQPLLPGSTLGVLGGGQLGRMLAHAAQRMGYEIAVLDPDPQSPAGRVSHHHLRADYLDPQALARLGELCQAISTEFENVPAAALDTLARSRVVSPAGAAVAVAQDRAREKAHFVACGVPVAPHALIQSASDASAVDPRLLPGILKTARMGYDGKGQRSVASVSELVEAWAALGTVPCVLEKRLPLAFECSVVLGRGVDGDMVHLPVQRNTHRGGILAVTEVYADAVPASVAQGAVAAARSVAEGLNYVGVLCVEFFVLEGGELVVNEIAPRPHNSGHYSIEACDVSQFELQVRTLAQLPLTPPRQHSPSIMLNLLGDLWPAEGQPAWAEVLAIPGAHLHLYGKHSARAGRKMGHLTLTASSVLEVRQRALLAARVLGLGLSEADLAPLA